MSDVAVESRGSSHNEGWQNLTEGGRWKSRSWTVKEQEAFASSTAAMLLQGRMRFSASISPSSGCPYCGCSCSAGMMTMFKNISSSSSSSSSSVASSASSSSTSVKNRTSFRPASGSFVPLGTNGWREGTKHQQTVVEETREEEEEEEEQQGKQEDEEKKDDVVPVAKSKKEAQPQPGRKKGKRKRRNSSFSGSSSPSSPSSPLTSKRDNHNSFWGRLRANTMNNSAGMAKGEKEKKKKAKKNKAASKKEKGAEQLAKLRDEIEEAPSSPALPRSSSSLPTSSKEKLSQQQKSAKQTEEGIKEKTWGKPVDLASLEVLNKLKHPIWIFDPDNVRMHWANHAALQLWNSPSLEELLSRDYEEDMSVATKTRIHHRREQLFSSPSESFTERWTFYPLKQPRPVRVTGSAVLVNEVHPAILAKEKKEAEANKQEQKPERNKDNKKEQKLPKWRVSLGSTIRNKHKKQHKEGSTTTFREPWLAMMVEGDVDRNVDQQTLRAVEAMTHTLSMISLYRMSDLKPLYLNPAALVVHSPFLSASIPSSASSSSSSSPAASLSSSSSYVHSNQSSSLVTKLSGEEGKEQLELFTFQDRFFHAQDFEDCMQALNEGKVFDREVLMRTPSFNTVVSNDTTSNNNSSDNVNANGHWHSLYARCTIDPATGEKAILVDEADISRRKLIEKSNSEKDSFLNMVSHEIRTPINGIIGFNSLLLETELNAEQREYVQSIQQSSKLLLAQVNDLLDIAKITEGKLLLDVVLVHFPTILSHILSLAEPLLENKFQNQKRINWNNCCSASSTHPSPSHPSRSSSPNSSSALQHSLEDLQHLHQQNEKSLRQRFKITAEIAEDVPHVLFGDPLRITQILMNFVSNAIKFTDIPDDSPDSFARVHIVISLLKKERSSSSCSSSSTVTSVTLQQKEKGEAENKTKTSEEREREEREEGVMLQMSVEDNGIGVPEDKKKYIFSSFMQADSSISRKYGGTGLGLSISKRLAQLMGGDCSFTSKVGVGSTFTATVHLQQRYQPPKLIASSSTITTAPPSTKKEEAQEILMHESSSYLFVINECDILCPSRSLSSSSSSSQQQVSCPYRNGSQKLLCETVKRCGEWKVQVMDSWQQLRKTVLELDTGTTRIILAICNDRGHIFSRSFFSPSSSSAFPSTSTTLGEPLHQLRQQETNDEKAYEAKEMEEIEEDTKEEEPEMYSCTLNLGGLMEEAREEGWLLGVEVWELNQDTESVLDFLNQTVFNTLEANTSQRSRSNVMKQIGAALGASSSSIPASSSPKTIASSAAAAAKTSLSSVPEEENRTNREEDKERETRAKEESGEEEENNVSRKIKRQRSQSLPATSKEKKNKKNDANALRQLEETESQNEKRRKKKKTKKHKRKSAGPTDSPISIPPLWKKQMQHNLRDHKNDEERDELHLGLLTVREEEEQRENEDGKTDRRKEGSSFRGARRMMKSSNHHHSRNLSYCNMFAGRGRHSLDWPFSTLSFSEEQSTAINKKKRHQSCKLFSFDDDDDEDGNDELSSTSSTSSSPPFLCQSIDSVVVAGRTNQQLANNDEKQTKHENEKEGTRPKRRSITMDSSYSLNNLRSIYPSPSTSPLQPTLKPHQPKQKADDNEQGAEEEKDANNFEERSINTNGNNRIIDVGATMLFNTARIGLSHTTLMCRKPSLSNTPRHKYNSSWVFDSATSPPPSCSSSCSSSASPSCSSSAASSCASSSKDVYCYPSYSSSLTSSSTTSTSSSSSGLPSPLCSSRCESHSGALLRSSSASTKLSSPSATRRRHSSTNIPSASSASSSDGETSATSTPRSSCPSSRSCSPRCTNISSPNGVSNLRQSSTTSPFALSSSKQVERRESTEDLQAKRRREEIVYDAEDEEDEPRNKTEAQRKLERTNESSPLLLHEQHQQQKTAITTSITTPRRVSNSPRRLFVGHDNSNHETPASRTVHRILVVEDNRMNQKLMHTILKSAGYAVELAEDGNEAVAMVKQHGAAHYSLILMDIMMPNCNGYEATMQIRQLASPSPSRPPSSSSSCSTPIDPAAATIPIVGVSATTASSVFEQCLASGMNDLIGKPYNVPALRAFLAQQLSPFSPSSSSSSSSAS